MVSFSGAVLGLAIGLSWELEDTLRQAIWFPDVLLSGLREHPEVPQQSLDLSGVPPALSFSYFTALQMTEDPEQNQ